MAQIRPFRAIRPKRELAAKIAALPYDVYNRREAKEEVEKEPESFLKIDRAESQFPDDVDTYADCVYEKAKETLWYMVSEGKFIQDEKPCYYIYELIMDGRSQSGIVSCASIDDYLNSVIKKHENTRAEKEQDRIRHVDTCNAQTGPIFLAYRQNETIDKVTKQVMARTPEYDFVSTDGITHRVWVISNESEIHAIADAFAHISQIYIADGHHRAASAVKVGLKRRADHPDYKGDEEFNYFLSVLFPDNQLKILDYNRVVKDLNGFSEKEFLEAVAEKFELVKNGKNPVKPEKKGSFGMFLDGEWYYLQAKENIMKAHPVEGLDVSILQNELLDPILGIKDPKTDARIDFVGGIRGLGELEKRVAEDCKVAFSMYPTSIQELFAVADGNLLMPPKSTWFEPKLRSGLFIHEL